MRLIIDADPIVYRAGFAGEVNHYDVVFEDAEGGVHHGYFEPFAGDKTTKRMTAWSRAQEYAEKRGYTVLDKTVHVVPEELDNALQIVRTQVLAIIDPVAKHYGIKHEDIDTRILLSGPGNFREDLAKLKPYKGNRDAAHKPFHYQAIRDYLTGQWGASVIHGREADDEVSIRAWEMRRDGRDRDYVIATIDKDLDQVPGMHYDYMKHVFTDVSEEYGERFFWQQMISGDVTDNIGGVCGYSSEKAKAFLDRVQSYADTIEHDWRKVAWDRVVTLYAQQAEYRQCYYKPFMKGDTGGYQPEDIALENARLVYMQQRPGELWVPPGAKPEYLESYAD